VDYGENIVNKHIVESHKSEIKVQIEKKTNKKERERELSKSI